LGLHYRPISPAFALSVIIYFQTVEKLQSESQIPLLDFSQQLKIENAVTAIFLVKTNLQKIPMMLYNEPIKIPSCTMNCVQEMR